MRGRKGSEEGTEGGAAREHRRAVREQKDEIVHSAGAKRCYPRRILYICIYIYLAFKALFLDLDISKIVCSKKILASCLLASIK